MWTSSSDGTLASISLRKSRKLGGPVPLVAFANYKAGGDIERCEERCGAMPDIGVGPALGHARHHWQNGLLAVERLDLTLLVNAEYQRPVGGREI